MGVTDKSRKCALKRQRLRQRGVALSMRVIIVARNDLNVLRILQVIAPLVSKLRNIHPVRVNVLYLIISLAKPLSGQCGACGALWCHS